MHGTKLAPGTDCASCTGLARCGWCVGGPGGAGTCLQGTSDGALTGTCTSWAWLGSSCPGGPDAGM